MAKDHIGINVLAESKENAEKLAILIAKELGISRITRADAINIAINEALKRRKGKADG